MNIASKKIFFVLISAAVLLAGCQKKPKRPDPSATMIGQGTGGGYDGSLNPIDIGTAAPGTGWTDLKPQVVSILLDHFVSEAPLFAGGTAADIAVPAEDSLLVEEDPANADIVAQINELLETRVRPAVAGDGGDIAYRGFKDGIVYLTLQGACSGCPSSTATLKHGIEGLLKHYVPEVTEVRAA